MTRPDSPAEREADLVDRLLRSVATASNDDLSEPGTEKRARHVERVTAMWDAVVTLRLRRPSEEEVARAANLIGEHVYAMGGHRTIAGLTEAARAVLAVFVGGGAVCHKPPKTTIAVAEVVTGDNGAGLRTTAQERAHWRQFRGWPNNSRAAWDDLEDFLARISDLEAAATEVAIKRDDIAATYKGQVQCQAGLIGKLVNAIGPLIELAGEMDPEMPDDEVVVHSAYGTLITAGQVRRAAALVREAGDGRTTLSKQEE